MNFLKKFFYLIVFCVATVVSASQINESKKIYSDIAISKDISDAKFFDILQETKVKELANETSDIFFFAEMFKLMTSQPIAKQMIVNELKNEIEEFTNFFDQLDTYLDPQKDNKYLKEYIAKISKKNKTLHKDISDVLIFTVLGEYGDKKDQTIYNSSMDVMIMLEILDNFETYDIIDDNMYEHFKTVLRNNYIENLLKHCKNSKEPFLQNFYNDYNDMELNDGGFFKKLLAIYNPSKEMIEENESLSEKIMQQINYFTYELSDF